METYRQKYARIWQAVEAYEKADHPDSEAWQGVKQALWEGGRDQIAVKLLTAEQEVIKVVGALQANDHNFQEHAQAMSKAMKDLKDARSLLKLFQDAPLD